MTSFPNIVTSLLFFQFTTNLEQSGSQIQDAQSLRLMFSLTVTIYLTKSENRDRKISNTALELFFEVRVLFWPKNVDFLQTNSDIRIKRALALKGIFSETAYVYVRKCQISSFQDSSNKFQTRDGSLPPSSPPQNKPLKSPLRLQLIRVPKVRFRIFDKLKDEIQKFITRFCFCLNIKNEVQIIHKSFRVKIDFYFEFFMLSFVFYFHKELKNELLKQIKINFMIIFISLAYTLFKIKFVLSIPLRISTVHWSRRHQESPVQKTDDVF